ncbi:hypothetical protein EIN_128740 [Entamoeba invadens IP1]|uniref:Glycerophosphocholine acyltransferase 1 n=1 Tax=Entamoeba invadens IP1 TaxID=370355 RepID=L7FN37_ENTIV|nr:hypothetical protein EIN_128740 [Entamoeba invadens IP1]ELP91564.1 hypothetical protein EIN_128740 [Entamoeba invadens IP1]|eukprot:XP_004258335.1 hypothetical protein EIN_128740 [Entamoeba invadens IP1]
MSEVTKRENTNGEKIDEQNDPNSETPVTEEQKRTVKVVQAIDPKNITIETIPAIDQSLKKKRNIKLVDKITFVMAFGIILLSEFIMLRRANLIPLLYLMLFIPLVVARYLVYRMSKWQLFLLDFCYFANAGMLLLLFLIYLFGIVGPLFEIIFINMTGPLLLAIIIWKNSFVFHDLTKLTSIVLHFFPNLVLYYLRWKSNFNIPTKLTFLTGFVYPISFYILWQALYLLITEVILRHKIYKGGYMTSIRWLCEEKPHMLYRFVTQTLGWWKDSKLKTMVYTQFIYTLVAYIPAYVCFYSKTAHRTFMIFTILWAAYNGANFYLEIFAKKYDQYLERFSMEKDKDSPK